MGKGGHPIRRPRKQKQSATDEGIASRLALADGCFAESSTKYLDNYRSCPLA
jgi:hypothetical protein